MTYLQLFFKSIFRLFVCDLHCHLRFVHIHRLPQYNYNKAIRDGKYLAPPHASAWQHSPH